MGSPISTALCPAGAEITLNTKMNAELYGASPPPPADIMDVRRCKRPPPFERLVKVRKIEQRPSAVFKTYVRAPPIGVGFISSSLRGQSPVPLSAAAC